MKQAGRALGIEVIPGVEMSTDVDEGEIHVLGYFLTYHNDELQTLLRILREARLGRAQKMVEKLGGLRPGMAQTIAKLSDIPTDINPIDVTADAIAPPAR